MKNIFVTLMFVLFSFTPFIALSLDDKNYIDKNYLDITPADIAYVRSDLSKEKVKTKVESNVEVGIISLDDTVMNEYKINLKKVITDNLYIDVNLNIFHMVYGGIKDEHGNVEKEESLPIYETQYNPNIYLTFDDSKIYYSHLSNGEETYLSRSMDRIIFENKTDYLIFRIWYVIAQEHGWKYDFEKNGDYSFEDRNIEDYIGYGEIVLYNDNLELTINKGYAKLEIKIEDFTIFCSTGYFQTLRRATERETIIGISYTL